MIVIDTHIWVWATENRDRLSPEQQAALLSAHPGRVFISAISIWEVAMLIQRGRLDTTMNMQQWIDRALLVGSIGVIELTPPIVCGAVALPEPFHRDPADRIIVATACILDCPLISADRQILAYPHVQTIA